jgi:hypothetical protein
LNQVFCRVVVLPSSFEVPAAVEEELQAVDRSSFFPDLLLDDWVKDVLAKVSPAVFQQMLVHATTRCSLNH